MMQRNGRFATTFALLLLSSLGLGISLALISPVDAFANDYDGGIGICEAKEGVVPPEPVFLAPPMYPPPAKGRGIGGEVLLRITVLKNGTVIPQRAELLKNTPKREGFKRSANMAARGWTYKPARMKNSGVPVNASCKVVVIFDSGKGYTIVR